mmetsp:Transcript_3625/g.6771  ORF Transcript_3625/g.6771 Transcript_3625/m.6771 type:complete len:413 (-) Transcript_3625:238-1476(-)
MLRNIREFIREHNPEAGEFHYPPEEKLLRQEQLDLEASARLKEDDTTDIEKLCAITDRVMGYDPEGAYKEIAGHWAEQAIHREARFRDKGVDIPYDELPSKYKQAVDDVEKYKPHRVVPKLPGEEGFGAVNYDLVKKLPGYGPEDIHKRCLPKYIPPKTLSTPEYDTVKLRKTKAERAQKPHDSEEQEETQPLTSNFNRKPNKMQMTMESAQAAQAGQEQDNTAGEECSLSKAASWSPAEAASWIENNTGDKIATKAVKEANFGGTELVIVGSATDNAGKLLSHFSRSTQAKVRSAGIELVRQLTVSVRVRKDYDQLVKEASSMSAIAARKAFKQIRMDLGIQGEEGNVAKLRDSIKNELNRRDKEGEWMDSSDIKKIKQMLAQSSAAEEAVPLEKIQSPNAEDETPDEDWA